MEIIKIASLYLFAPFSHIPEFALSIFEFYETFFPNFFKVYFFPRDVINLTKILFF